MHTGDPHLFVFGMGYTAQHLAARWQGRLTGTRRAAEGDGPGHCCLVQFDGAAPVPAHLLQECTHLLVSIPPSTHGDVTLEHHAALIGCLKRLRWVGYLSTTGVYGDTGGALVDERSPTRPSQPRSQRRLQAEQAWLALHASAGTPVHVFRLSGIYGPGRSALDQVRRGAAQRVLLPGHVSCRVHVDDIVSVLLASMDRPEPGAIYNVSDDEPCASEAVVAHACALLGVQAPPLTPFEHAQLSPMARSFYTQCRRVDNARIKRDLSISLRHPTYREGLCAILDAEALLR